MDERRGMTDSAVSLFERFGHSLLFGHVAGDLRGSYDFSSRIFDGRNGQRNI
jgi:hypothetical protein